MRNIKTIVLHCTATKPDHDVEISHVREWHVKGNGWRDVGYHWLIKLDGTVEAGRPFHQVGAGVKGHNANALHVAYVGGLDDDGVPADTMTDDQVAAWYQLATSLVRVIGPMDLKGHNDFTDDKACPSFKVSEKFTQLAAWCQSGDGTAPGFQPKQRQPAPVVSRQYCQRCNRRVRR